MARGEGGAATVPLFTDTKVTIGAAHVNTGCILYYMHQMHVSEASVFWNLGILRRFESNRLVCSHLLDSGLVSDLFSQMRQIHMLVSLLMSTSVQMPHSINAAHRGEAPHQRKVVTPVLFAAQMCLLLKWKSFSLPRNVWNWLQSYWSRQRRISPRSEGSELDICALCFWEERNIKMWLLLRSLCFVIGKQLKDLKIKTLIRVKVKSCETTQSTGSF